MSPWFGNLVTRCKDPDPTTGQITANSPVWQYEYDATGNQTKVTTPLGSATTGNANDFATRYEYDGLGRVTKAIDADGKEIVTQYDQAGRVMQVTDRMSRITKYGYNALDQMIDEKHYDTGAVAPVPGIMRRFWGEGVIGKPRLDRLESSLVHPRLGAEISGKDPTLIGRFEGQTA